MSEIWTPDNDIASEGPLFAEFCQRFLTLGGSFGGNPFVLYPWQREIMNELLTLRPDGLRKHKVGLVGMPRKQGKSQIAAALAIYMLVADGEPNAQIFSVAGAKDQARIVFREAKRMIQASPELSDVCKVYQHHIEVPKTNSVYRVLSADGGLAQGLEPHAVIIDELHVHKSADLYEAMTLGSATRRNPLILSITTAGFDHDTICYHLYDYGKRVKSGEIDDPSFYFKWFEPSDPGCHLDDRDAWHEANPALGTFKREEDMEAARLQQHESAFRRYYLNQWTETHNAWLPHGAWDGLAKPERKLEPGESIICGFDGAWRGDSTALVGISTEDFHVQVLGHWERPLDDEHWRVPVDEVEQQIREVARQFNVREIVLDPYRWERSISVLDDEGLPMVEFPTNSIGRMAPATQAFYDAVRDQKVSHDGDPALSRHMANCVLKEDARGARVTKSNKSSERKIDLAIATIIAYARAVAFVEPQVLVPRIITF